MFFCRIAYFFQSALATDFPLRLHVSAITPPPDCYVGYAIPLFGCLVFTDNPLQKSPTAFRPKFQRCISQPESPCLRTKLRRTS